MFARLTRQRNFRRNLTRATVGVAIASLLVGISIFELKRRADERVWEQFVQWLPSAPSADSAAPIFIAYREHLKASGVSEADSRKQLAVIRKLQRSRPESRRMMFDNIYSNEPGFNTKPNALLVTTVNGRPPGRALDVAMGQGRNAVFLAGQGWDVTGFDVSSVGLDTAKRNAARAGVEIKTVLKSRDEFDFGTEQWDLIVITYETIPLEVPDYAERLRKSLRKGGLIVVETTASDAGRPLTRSTDVDPARLLRSFSDLRVLRFEDGIAMPDWGHYKTRLVRFVAEK